MNVVTQRLFWLYIGSVFGRILVHGLNCNPGEYEIKDVCCPMCAPGNVIKNDCTVSGNTECIPCVEGTYMDHINAVFKCLRCRECDSGSGLTVDQKCNYISNTICRCKDGYFCNRDYCDLCQPFKECLPGESVKEYGTRYSDTVCQPCPEETFSDEIMSTSCNKWTKCSEIGLKESQSGTSTSNSVCSGKLRNRYYSFFLLLIMIPMFTIWKYIGKKKTEKQAHMETAEKPNIKIQTPMETDDGMFDSHEPQQEQGGR